MVLANASTQHTAPSHTSSQTPLLETRSRPRMKSPSSNASADNDVQVASGATSSPPPTTASRSVTSAETLTTTTTAGLTTSPSTSSLPVISELEPSPKPAVQPAFSGVSELQERQSRAEAAAAWRVDDEPANIDEDDEKVSETVLYIGNLPGAREFDDAAIWDRLTYDLKSRLGHGAPFKLNIYECLPDTDGRRWARLGLYRDADAKKVLSLHDTLLCDRFVKIRQSADYEIVGIGKNPPKHLEKATVCNNCGTFITHDEFSAWYGAPNVCRKCGDARRVLKNLVQARQKHYGKSPIAIVEHLRRRISHPRHVHRRAYEKVCRYGRFCVRARKGTCWYAHNEYERSIGDLIRFYIQNFQQPVRSAAGSFNPDAAEFTPASRLSSPDVIHRSEEAEVWKAVNSITNTTQQLRDLNLQKEMQNGTLMQLAEECALTYQLIRQELMNRHQVQDVAAEEPNDETVTTEAAATKEPVDEDDQPMDIVVDAETAPADTKKQPQGGEEAKAGSGAAELQTVDY